MNQCMCNRDVLGGVYFSTCSFFQYLVLVAAIKDGYILSSERRIKNLEQQLSVTGEEMGESAVAMRVKLDTLSKKTDDLWAQMDKLWASAWRRNQADIEKLNQQIKNHKALFSKQTKQNQTNTATLKSMGQKQTETEFTVGILNEQVQAAQTFKSQLEDLQNKMASIQSKTMGKDKQQIELASTISQLTSTQKILLQRIQQLEAKISRPKPL